METKRITTLEELRSIAEEILSVSAENASALVISLKGDLGAGKTAFVKEFAKLLGITHEITSPTFVVMKSYEIESHSFLRTLVHIDAYRIESDDEMRVLKFNELLRDPTNVICIEWPEKIPTLIPKDAFEVTLTLNGDGTRDVRYGK